MKNKFVENKWKIFVSVIVFWMVGMLALGYIAYTSTPPSGSSKLIESVKIVFLSLGGLGVVLPTYINAMNAIEGRNVEKLENTFRLIEKWDDPLMFAARKFTRELKAQKGKLSDEALVEKIEGDPELKHSIILVINYFDQIRFSEKTKRIDCALFNKSLGPVMKDYHQRFRPWVQTHGELYLKDWDDLLELAKIA